MNKSSGLIIAAFFIATLRNNVTRLVAPHLSLSASHSTFFSVSDPGILIPMVKLLPVARVIIRARD